MRSPSPSTPIGPAAPRPEPAEVGAPGPPSACGTTRAPARARGPGRERAASRSMLPRAIAPALAPASTAPPPSAGRIAAQAGVPAQIAGIRSGSPPGRWMTSAARGEPRGRIGRRLGIDHRTTSTSTDDARARRHALQRVDAVAPDQSRPSTRGRRRDDRDPDRAPAERGRPARQSATGEGTARRRRWNSPPPWRAIGPLTPGRRAGARPVA